MKTIDPKVFRSVMGQFATGVTVITNKSEDTSQGMTANAFMSVSLDPPLVVVSVRRASRFVAQVLVGSRYGVSFLCESQQDLSSHFGGRPVAGFTPTFVDVDGVPLIDGALAHIVACVGAIHEAGDHLLYVGRIEHLSMGEQRRPLIFYGGKYKQVHAHEPTFSWATGDGW